MHPELFLEHRDVRRYYVSLFGQFFMIFFAFNSLVFDDVSPIRIKVMTLNLAFFSLLALYTVKKLVEMIEDLRHPFLYRDQEMSGIGWKVHNNG
ncbi:hypothetical protein SAMN04488696_2502 [Methanolobus profundi]|uniref:Uncharacterized protein n=1 Tax=Methanolobus profundi TaxID=487685 RepID=A0A1I4U1Y9_9EURY|nr:hypothetical protein SAMN04488696_2502 [Methanolobus profundi]